MRKASSAALVIGFTIQGLAIARALTKCGISVYALVHRDASRFRLIKHPVFYTNSVQFIFAESVTGDALIDALLVARKAIPESQVALFAVTDNTVMALARHWSSLQQYYVLSWSNCRRNIERIVQKSNLPEICDRAGVRYPRTMVVQAETDIESCLTHFSFPILLKPDKQAFSFKTHRCDTAGDFRAFVKSQIDIWPLIAQEWIAGTERSLYFYTCFSKAGVEHFGFIGQKVRTSPPGVGIATILETTSETEIRDAARKLLPILDITGPVAMEFKKDDQGDFWFIEANVGRTEFCVDLAIQAGFNLPYVEFASATGAPWPPATDWVECMWFDTDKEPFCYLSLCLRERTLRPHGKRPVFPYHGQERWQVRFAALFEVLRKTWTRTIKKVGGLFS